MTLLLIQQNQNEDVQQLKECAKEQFHQLNITAFIDIYIYIKTRYHTEFLLELHAKGRVDGQASHGGP